jgi:hypothetical protein
MLEIINSEVEKAYCDSVLGVSVHVQLALLLFVCGEAVHHGEEQAATNLIDWN